MESNMEDTAIKPGVPTRTSAIQPEAAPAVASNGVAAPRRAPKPLWQEILQPVASLRLTVALFAMAMVLVFYGTWAQVDLGIWHVVSQYFRAWLVFIPAKVLLFQSVPDSPFAIPFPGGKTIGLLLFVNLLAAHAVRFKMTWKRSGIFILHAGVIVLMVSEALTGAWAVEGIMQIAERSSANYLQHPHSAEFAIIDRTDPKMDDTVAIPSKVLRDGLVSHEKLPFDIELVGEYMTNSAEIAVNPSKKNPATAGFGLTKAVVRVAEVSGADPEQKYDAPAAYIALKDKQTGAVIDTYLVQFFWVPQTVKFGDKTYEIALRPKRSYRDFSVFLEKADFKTYPGTNIPKDYSSYVQIFDKDGQKVRTARIYMNHPMYFNNETYFQSSMEVERRPLITGLQVVRNPANLFIGGWRITLPVVALTMVGVGMLVHFGILLIQFLQRRSLV
jgi:ResB-like family